MPDVVLSSKLMYTNLDVDQTEDAVLAEPGRVYWIHAINHNAALLYLKFYDGLVADVVVGTTVPDLTLVVPVLTAALGDVLSVVIPGGIDFTTAITIACTTGFAVADTGAPGANDCIVNLCFV